jgi:SAM-dependent methyltransferase
MTARPWEDLVALNATSEYQPTAIGPASAYRRSDGVWSRFDDLAPMVDQMLERDRLPLPDTQDREGYYGDDHYHYWLSGALDAHKCREVVAATGLTPRDFLDLGAATGRVTRHFATQVQGSKVWSADINLRHVRWTNEFLAPAVRAFQNTSIPSLPFADRSFDVVTAFSVFSHIETFDHAWLLEISRILRPEGVAILTANIENWQHVDERWPVYRAVANHPSFDPDWLGRPLDSDRRVFRWRNDGSYSSVVFMSEKYVRQEWGAMMEIVDILPKFTQYQTAVVLRPLQ